MPCLHEISLKSINLPWSSLRGLTSLSLTQCSDSDATSSPPTFEGLLRMLSSSPQLESLKLDCLIPPPISEQHYPTVALPHLICISIRDPVDQCGALLAHLCLPDTARVELTPWFVRSGVDVRNLLIPVPKHAPPPAPPPPPSSKSSAMTTIHRTTSPPSLFTPNALLSLTSHPHTEHALRQIMAKVFKALPCERITHLDTRSAPRLSEVSWTAALRFLPALETVYLQCSAGTGACKVLRTLLDIERGPPAERGSRPRVRCINLLVIMWDRGGDGDSIEDLLGLLVQFLQLRRCRCWRSTTG
ncbi:hypothetical protein B0H17DRAFT_1335411 [Mycena rosella]|uniref:F-box domain-containing protein n=1 Tax=Mycena rosella TaxID=1033263 RepID=A0AAD7D127_MYCRO|nr:hypothetical protein B0H17DRAFT_1335411 [Mycena rosella]